MDRKLNPATGVLTWLAGASPDVLHRCGRSEQMKFAALGATVLIPAGVGFFACWYTVFSLTKQMGVAVILGLAWSLMLIAIDRAILITYKKGEKQAGKVLIRMALAGVAGILVAHVLVLYVFRDLIAERQNSWRRDKIEQIETTGKKEMEALRLAEEAKWQPKISAKENEIANLQSERDSISGQIAATFASIAEEQQKIAEDEQAAADRNATKMSGLQADLAKLNTEYAEEIRGKGGSVAGYGPKAKALQLPIEALNTQIASAETARAQEITQFDTRRSALEAKEKSIAPLEEQKSEKISQIEQAQTEKNQILTMQDFSAVDNRHAVMVADVQIERERTYDDILSQTEALHQIVMEGVRRGEPSAAIGYLLLVLLFFTLDTIPIITKIMLPAGTYDRILDRDLQDTETLARLESEERMALFHTLASERAGERIQEERLRIQLNTVRGVARAKLDTFQEIHRRLSDARRDVAAVNAGDLKSINKNMSDSARDEAESALQILETKFLAQAQNIVEEYSNTADSTRIVFDEEEDDVIKLTLRDNGVPTQNPDNRGYANGIQNTHATQRIASNRKFDDADLLAELDQLEDLTDPDSEVGGTSPSPRRRVAS